MMSPMTCTLSGGAQVVFDVTDSTQEDHDETGNLLDLFVRTVG